MKKEDRDRIRLMTNREDNHVKEMILDHLRKHKGVHTFRSLSLDVGKTELHSFLVLSNIHVLIREGKLICEDKSPHISLA